MLHRFSKVIDGSLKRPDLCNAIFRFLFCIKKQTKKKRYFFKFAPGLKTNLMKRGLVRAMMDRVMVVVKLKTGKLHRSRILHKAELKSK